MRKTKWHDVLLTQKNDLSKRNDDHNKLNMKTANITVVAVVILATLVQPTEALFFDFFGAILSFLGRFGLCNFPLVNIFILLLTDTCTTSFTTTDTGAGLTVSDGFNDSIPLDDIADFSDSNDFTFTVDGGVDAADFVINADNELEFVTPPVIASPVDADEDNVYEVTIRGVEGAIENTINLMFTVSDDA